MKLTVWTRLLLFLLLCSMLFGIVACTNENDPKTPSESTTDEVKELDYPFTVKRFGDKKTPARFNIAVRPESSDYMDTDALNGTVIDDAVYKRNNLIEDLFNVEITLSEISESTPGNFRTRIEFDVMLGTSSFDCVQGWGEAGLESTGYLKNLLAIPELDFANDPWWLDTWHENTTFLDVMMTCNGDLQLELYRNTEVIYFNKTMAQGLKVEDEGNLSVDSLLYQHVDNKTWTLDTLQKYAALAANDAGEDGFHNRYEAYQEKSQDVFGNLLNDDVANVAMFAMGAKYTEFKKSEYNYPNSDFIEFTISGPQHLAMFDKLFAFYNENECNYKADASTQDKESYEIFNDGHAFFCWNTFDVAPKIKESGVSYGLLPLPTYEAGSDYITTSYNPFSSYFTFLKNTPDIEKSALILNAMNALSTDILYNDYFGEYLGFRDSEDPNSARMVPLICDSIYFDLLWAVPNFGGGHSFTFSKAINQNYKWFVEEIPEHLRANASHVKMIYIMLK